MGLDGTACLGPRLTGDAVRSVPPSAAVSSSRGGREDPSGQGALPRHLAARVGPGSTNAASRKHHLRGVARRSGKAPPREGQAEACAV